MYINDNNKYLVLYIVTCEDEDKIGADKRDEVEYERQKILVANDFIEHMNEYPERYKLSDKGSRELLAVYPTYRDQLRVILINNSEKHRRSHRKVKIQDIIEALGLGWLEDGLADEWVDHFIRSLFREGFFAWWQPQYSDDSSEISYYYSDRDEDDFLKEKQSKTQ